MSSSEESGDESDIEGDISYSPTPTPPEPVAAEPPIQEPQPVIASPQPTKPPQSPSFLPRVFTPRLSRLTSQNNVPSTTTTDSATPAPVDSLTAKPRTLSQSPAGSRSGTPANRVKRPRFKRNKKGTDYSFSTDNDILGIVMLEIACAEDLPKLKNSAFY